MRKIVFIIATVLILVSNLVAGSYEEICRNMIPVINTGYFDCLNGLPYGTSISDVITKIPKDEIKAQVRMTIIVSYRAGYELCLTGIPPMIYRQYIKNEWVKVCVKKFEENFGKK